MAFRITVAIIALAIIAGFAYLYSGAYPVGADVPHSAPVTWFVRTLKNRSVESHASDVKNVPNLDDSTLILEGARHYEHDCRGCHLAPGHTESETAKDMYPHPPKFTKGTDLSPEQFFWITKHGLKDTGMPAWGKSSSDDELWSLVAFVERRIAKLSPEQYQELVARAPNEHAEESEAQGSGG